MNKFPYNNGHLMVTPYRHVNILTALSPEEAHGVMDGLQRCVAVLKQAFNPQGINIGLNIGEAAGAGIEEHLHFHLVPRWNGDSSFMAVFSETRVVPEHLTSTYDRLKPLFAEKS
jgi:ATP adenylyltransferase